MLDKRVFVDVPFRLHGHDPDWVPPLRLTSTTGCQGATRRPPTSGGHCGPLIGTARPVGRIGACIDSLFNEHQGEAWAWVGFFDCVDDYEVARSLFDVALDWCRRQGAEMAVGPANFTTNDEIGLLVDGFETPATLTHPAKPALLRRAVAKGGLGADHGPVRLPVPAATPPGCRNGNEGHWNG